MPCVPSRVTRWHTLVQGSARRSRSSTPKLMAHGIAMCDQAATLCFSLSMARARAGLGRRLMGRGTNPRARFGSSPIGATMRTKMIRALHVLVLIGFTLTIPPQCLGKERLDRSDWSNVQNIAPGAQVRITLLDRQIPRESRRFRGVFAFADESGVSAVLADGSTRTFEKQAVRRVAVRRPLLKRPGAWIATGIAAGVVQATLGRYVAGDWGWGGATATFAMLIYLPVWGVTTLMMSHKVVYDSHSP